MTARTRTRTTPTPCEHCDTVAPSRRDLVIHLVESHDAVWASTNSFELEDLLIPAPRHACDDEVVLPEVGLLRRLVRRTA